MGMMTGMRVVASVVLALVAVGTAGCTGSRTASGHGKLTSSAARSAPRGSASTSRSPSAPPAIGSAAAQARFFAPQQVRAVLTAAQHALQIVNTYDYRHLAADLAAGTSLTSGAYRKQYRTSFQKSESAVGKAHQAQQATVSAIGVGPTVRATATVLAFGRLRTTSTAVPAGRVVSFGVVARLTRTDGQWLLSGVSSDPLVITGPPTGTPGLAAATAAARVAVRTVLTLRGASFDKDHARALAVTAGPLRARLRAGAAVAKRSVASGVELGATVPAVAAARAGGKRAVFLVRAQAVRTTKGVHSAAVPRNLQVTMAMVRGRWAAVELTTIG